MADDLGIGDLGVTGQLDRAAQGLPALQTPNIDALASQSLRFNNMYATPVCASTRASLLSGFHQGHSFVDTVRAGVHIRGGDEDRTWGQVLQDAGYKTSMFGKWHLGGVDGFTSVDDLPATPVQKGFEEVYGSLIGSYRTSKLWESDGTGSLQLSPVEQDPSWPGPGPPYQYSEDATANRIEEFIEANANSSQPFSIYAAFNAPHAPAGFIPQGSYANEDWPDGLKNYAAMIARLDQHVGQIVSRLEDPDGNGDDSDSVMDNTMIVFTSDNGPLWREKPVSDPTHFDPEFFNSNGSYDGHKASTREGGVRVPFFVRWDGVAQPGDNNNHVGSLADVMPTVAELVGEDTPIGIDGQSMLAPIRGEGTGARPDVFSSFYHQSFGSYDLHGWSVRVKDWKLVQLESSGPQLYDLSEDPFEQNNLATSRQDILNALQSVGESEGYGREPIVPKPDFPQFEWTQNTLFTQYKTWQPMAGSIDFGAASNWGGGTPIGVPDEPEAQNWNTGPADNWLATLANTSGSDQHVLVSTDAEVLAMDVRGMSGGFIDLHVPSGVSLSARNGLRVSAGGRVRLEGGDLNTIREIDVRLGGALIGEGSITGQQHVLAGIAEFQNQGLMEPEVVNAGIIDLEGLSEAGLLTIDGNLRQTDTGLLDIDLYGGGGVPGISLDKIVLSGQAILDGLLSIGLEGNFVPNPGDTFEIVSAASLIDEGLQLTGAHASHFALSILDSSKLILTYLDADFNRDSFVDNDDLLNWKSGFGITSGASLEDGDADGDGDVDSYDFMVWQRALGSGLPLAGSQANVPEPCTALLITLAFVIGSAHCRASKRLWQKEPFAPS